MEMAAADDDGRQQHVDPDDDRQQHVDPDDAGPYIPAELIPNIVKHLTSLHDIFALRGACRAYRAVLPLCRDLLAAQPPHLLVPHSSSSLTLYHLLQPGCTSFSLALYHLPQRRILRFRARLPFARTDGIITSDGARVVTVDDATGEILVTHLLSGHQIRIPKPPSKHDRVILTGGFVFAPVADRMEVQYCNLGNTNWICASYGGEDQIQDLRIVNHKLYALLPTGQLATAPPVQGNIMELWPLGFAYDEQFDQALLEAVGGMLLGECGGEVILICKVGSINPAYKIFRWKADKGMWARTMSLGGRTLFIGYDDFVACLGPDVQGIRGDCVYASLPWTGGWSEYSLIDGTCSCIIAEYPGEPGVGFGRPQVWVLPSLFCN